MGIYHFTFKGVSRNRGQSAIASSAYRRGALMKDERLGKNFNFLHKEEVVYSALIIPENAPLWLKKIQALASNKSAETFWNLVEKKEVRCDANLCYEVEVALPNEFSLEESINLIKEFVESSFSKKGMVADCSLHFKENNHHAHILLSTRELNDTGFGNKVISWKQKKALYNWREEFAYFSNKHLLRNSVNYQISHKSNIELGIELIPLVHEGPAKISDNKELNKEIKASNLAKIKDRPELLLQLLTSTQHNFTIDDIAYKLNTLFPNPVSLPIIKNALAALEESAKLSKLNLKHLNLKKIVFSDKDLARAINLRTNTEVEFTELMLRLKKNLIVLGPGDDGRIRYTTPSAFLLESALQEAADFLASRCLHRVKIKPNLNKYNLSNCQIEALKHILTKKDLAAIVGYAGTGKSYLMNAAREVWEEAGFKVQGIALAGIAAEGLEISSNIKSSTIQSFRLKLEREPLNKKDIIVLDEAGMVDSNTMAFIVHKVQKAHAKLVMLGDAAQLAPIGAGVPFKAITERIGSAILDEVIRQKIPWQKEATLEFAKYQTKSALTRYLNQGNIFLVSSPKEQLINDWQASLTKESLKETTILALSNKEVLDLNLRARDRLFKNQREITLITYTGPKSITSGERLIFLKNDYKLGVRNGTKGTVIDLDTLSIQLDNGNIINLPPFAHIDYGYASTVHKAQGITVNNSFVLFSPYWYKNLSYVAMSRHRELVKAYADLSEYKDSSELIEKLSRWQIKDSVIGLPINFSFRRGLEFKNFALHIASYIKKTIKRMANKNQYIKSKGKRNNMQPQTDITTRQNDAKLVARYTDLNILSGQLWQSNKLEQLKDVNYERQSLAYLITQNINKYQLALEQNQVSISKLYKESSLYKHRLEVSSYLKTNGLKSQKSAAKIYHEIRKYYPFIKELNVDIKQLKTKANNYNRLLQLKSLTANDRQKYYLIEKYTLINKARVKAWAQAFNKTSHKETNRAMAEHLSKQQAKLAYLIHNDLEQYSALLALHNITPGKDYAYVPNASELKANQIYSKLCHLAGSHRHYLARENSTSEKKQFFPIGEILDRLQDNAHSFALSILGNPTRRSTADTLYFGTNQGSLAVKVQGANYGLWYDFSSLEGGNLIQLVEKEYGLDFKDALDYCANWLGISPDRQSTNIKKIAPEKSKTFPQNTAPKPQKNTSFARQIFKESFDIQGTLAETYLNKRGISVNDIKDVRFTHAFEPETKQHLPALVVAGRDKENNIQTIQLTYLSPDATKANIKVQKRTYGSFLGATSMIQTGVGNTIAITEGLETGLSIANTNPDLSVAISFGSLSKITLPSNFPNVIICADNDGNNSATQIGLEKAIDNLTKQNRLVYVIKPELEGEDFNDVLQAKGINALTQEIKQAKLITKHLSHHDKLEVYNAFKNITHRLVGKISKTIDEEQNFSLALNNARRMAHELQESPSITSFDKAKLSIDAKMHQEQIEVNTPQYKIIEAYIELRDEYQALLKPNLDVDSSLHIKNLAKVGRELKRTSFLINEDPLLLKEAKQQNLHTEINLYAKQHRQNVQLQQEKTISNEQAVGD